MLDNTDRALELLRAYYRHLTRRLRRHRGRSAPKPAKTAIAEADSWFRRRLLVWRAQGRISANGYLVIKSTEENHAH